MDSKTNGRSTRDGIAAIATLRSRWFLRQSPRSRLWGHPENTPSYQNVQRACETNNLKMFKYLYGGSLIFALIL
ncbi:hypothetical protein GBA52_024910 [Prunus armeniaca]|nr:hypothetical protein GBA52_024910 [Prunus armeniaca]